MAYIKEQTLVFDSGRRLSIQGGIVGISPFLEVSQGRSGILIPREPFLDDDDALTDAERIELADLMIQQWQAFKCLSQ
ncbi:MAG: hypothetical protein ACN6OP_11165 [Pseudomonadales bacterium]